MKYWNDDIMCVMYYCDNIIIEVSNDNAMKDDMTWSDNDYWNELF